MSLKCIETVANERIAEMQILIASVSYFCAHKSECENLYVLNGSNTDSGADYAFYIIVYRIEINIVMP